MQKRAKSPLKPTPKAYDFSGENREQRIGNWFVNNRDFLLLLLPPPKLGQLDREKYEFLVFFRGGDARVVVPFKLLDLFTAKCEIWYDKFFSTIKVDNNTRVFKR